MRARGWVGGGGGGQFSTAGWVGGVGVCGGGGDTGPPGGSLPNS